MAFFFLFWNCVINCNGQEGGGEPPKGSLAWAVENQFGSLDSLIQKVNVEGAALQGSGWVVGPFAATLLCCFFHSKFLNGFWESEWPNPSIKILCVFKLLIVACSWQWSEEAFYWNNIQSGIVYFTCALQFNWFNWSHLVYSPFSFLDVEMLCAAFKFYIYCFLHTHWFPPII